MFARPEESDLQRARKATMWLGLGVLLILTLTMALLGRSGVRDQDSVAAMATVAAFGTFAMGWLCARVSPYPRWSLIAAGSIMAGAILMSAALVEPATWNEEMRPTTWMLPWFLLTIGIMPGRKSGVCAPAHPRAGWFMIVGSLLMALLLLGLPAIVDAIRGR